MPAQWQPGDVPGTSRPSRSAHARPGVKSRQAKPPWTAALGNGAARGEGLQHDRRAEGEPGQEHAADLEVVDQAEQIVDQAS